MWRRLTNWEYCRWKNYTTLGLCFWMAWGASCWEHNITKAQSLKSACESWQVAINNTGDGKRNQSDTTLFKILNFSLSGLEEFSFVICPLLWEMIYIISILWKNSDMFVSHMAPAPAVTNLHTSARVTWKIMKINSVNCFHILAKCPTDYEHNTRSAGKIRSLLYVQVKGT